MERIPEKLLALLLAACLATAGMAGAMAEGGESAILDMLKGIPQSAFDSGWLSFADIGVMIANRPGAALPDSIGAYEQVKGTLEGSLLLNVYMGLSAGPSDFYIKLGLYRELLEASGVDFFTVRRAAETGILPNRQIWLAGDLDMAGIKVALKEKGYAPLPDTLAGTEVWCKDGDLASGTWLDLKSRDTGFLFGGNLGQSWPVLFRGGLVGATPDADAVSAAVYRPEPSLAEPGAISDLVKAIPLVNDSGAGEIAQLYLMKPSAGGLDLPGLPEMPGATVLAEEPLPAYSLAVLAHVYTHGAQWVAVGLAFPDAASAQAAGPILNQRLGRAGLQGSDQLLMARISAMGGQLEPYRVMDGTGGAILVLPFRFPDESGAIDSDGKPTPSGAPYRLFVRMLMQRGLGWLMPGQRQ